MTESFGAESTTDEVLEGVDLTGKRCLVTGVSAGLGVETARTLVAHGAYVVGTARDLAKARAATGQIYATKGGSAGLQLVEMDLSSLASVRACADALVARGQAFDLIIANAGVMACPQGTTSDGFETQFGTNHLGHFVFVNRLAMLLKSAGRLVNLSSLGHRYGDIDLEDLNFTHTTYSEFVAYGRSKTANILFSVEFDRRYKPLGIRAVAVHPGGIQTELNRHTPREVTEQLIASINAQRVAGAPAFKWKTIPQGAATTVWAGVVATPEEIGGRYCENCQVAKIRDDDSVRNGVRSYALDPVRAKALWVKSEELVGEHFPGPHVAA